jgi:hypothetical protein
MNIITLENMRNDDIFRIIMQNQSYNDILDEIKSPQLDKEIANILDKHPTKTKILNIVKENLTFKELKVTLNLKEFNLDLSETLPDTNHDYSINS